MTMSEVFPANMLKTCWFSTLRELNYSTTISLNNPRRQSQVDNESLLLSLDLFTTDGEVVLQGVPIGELKVGTRLHIDIEQLLRQHQIDTEIVGLLHQTPMSLVDTEFVPFDLRSISKWTYFTDEFVGYRHNQSGLQSGVHYQSPPMNDRRIPSSSTTIMQSPKVVISSTVDSLLLCLAPSSDSQFSNKIDFHLAVLDEDGQIHGRTKVSIPPRGRALISVKELLKQSQSLDQFLELGGFGMVVGLATNGALIPLALAMDERGGLAIDHSLPPSYYIPWWGGEPRKQAAKKLVSRIFPDVRV